MLPGGISLPPEAVVLDSKAAGPVRTLIVQAPGTVGDAYLRYKAQLEAAGHHIVKVDDEGHEAELYFTLPGAAFAAIQVVRPRCPDGVVRILFSTSDDPAAGASSVTTALPP